MRRAWVAVLLLPLLSLVCAGRVQAHAALSGSSPEQGAVVTTPLGAVTLTFSEAVVPTADGFDVVFPDGSTTEPAAASADGATWELTFTPVSAGVVAVSYDVVSVDGHSVTGELTFTVDVAPAPTVPPTVPPTVTAPPAPVATAAEPTLPPVAVATPPTVVPVPSTPPASDGGSGNAAIWAIVLAGGAALIGGIVWVAARRGAS